MTVEGPVKKPVPRRTGATESFYSSSLSLAQRIKLEEARAIEGLEEEIAILRVRLEEAISEATLTELPELLRGMDVLAKVVAIRYKLSPGSQKQLQDALFWAVSEVESRHKEAPHGD